MKLAINSEKKNKKYNAGISVFAYFERIKRLLFKDDTFIGYIGGSAILPEPLNKEEEKNALLKLSNGDDSIKQVLIERNLRLVVYIARKFDNTNVGLEDLISIGAIGLIKAVNTFDPGRNFKLATYASRCIENEILMHLRKTSKLKTEISIDEPLNTDWDGNKLLLSDILGTDENIVSSQLEEKDNKRMVLEAVMRLNKRDMEIMSMRFGLLGYDCKTQKQVADYLGISQSYISRLEKRIFLKLKKDLIKNDIAFV